MAYPILLNYLLSSVFELLDKAIVGHYSVQGFAVVGVAASFTYAITGALGILSAAFHIVAAKEKGQDNEQGFETAFLVSRHLALSIGTCFFVLSLAGGRLFFQKVYGVQGDDLSELLSYFYPTAFTVIQNMLVFQYSAYFRNCLNTRITLYSTIVSTGVNLFFDFSLVHGVFGLPRLGTAGAAWGSVIGLAAGLLIYQSVYWKKQFSLSMYSVTALLRALKQQSVSAAAKNTAWEILRLYPSLLGQELIENTIFACVITAAIARLGTEQMAIYSLLDTVGSTIGLPIYAYASATQTFALQRYSARDPASARRYLRSGMLLAFGAVTFLCALCGIFSKPLLLLVVDDPRIVTRTRTFLPFVFLLLLARIIQQIPMSCLQGIGREKFVLLCTTIGTAGASIGILTMGNLAGLTGLYLVMTTELTMLGICYLRQISK